MTKPELLSLMRLLSGLESFVMSNGQSSVPDYLIEELVKHVKIIERDILK